MTAIAQQAGSVLEAQRLTVRYRAATACKEVSLSVERGCVYVLFGHEGAGKSSLVRCLLGRQKPTEGRALLFGQDSRKARAKAMARVGLVPEEPQAPPRRTVAQIARLYERVAPRWEPSGVADRLLRFGVPADVPFGRLTKTEKRQAMFTFALGHSPELLVLDDPILGLNAVARKPLFEELARERARHDLTVFVATGDPAGFEEIATRVGILSEGCLVVDEAVETLKSRFRHIHYRNERTETRTEFGAELDAFDAVRVKARGWGIDAVVSNYDERSFETFRRTDGVVDAEVFPISLEGILLAVAGTAKGGRA